MLILFYNVKTSRSKTTERKQGKSICLNSCCIDLSVNHVFQTDHRCHCLLCIDFRLKCQQLWGRFFCAFQEPDFNLFLEVEIKPLEPRKL